MNKTNALQNESWIVRQRHLLRRLVKSTYLDLFGAALILGVCISLSFHTTIYYQGKIQFNIPLDELWSHYMKGAYPLGILSTLGAVFSLLSTRLVGKQKNVGNIIGVITTINSGLNDFLFGNASAAITYPLTFFIHTFAVAKWHKGVKIRDRDIYYYLINIAGLLVAFGMVYLGAYIFGGRTDNLFLIIVAITFGLSLGANVCNAFKYEETWFSWIVYNFIQLIKNAMQLNIANVVKYIFYLFNAAITLFDWKINRDAD